MSIYKECDIRGVYGPELTEEDAFLIGQAVGTRIQGRSVVVGGDVRVSTPALKEALIRGLLACGAEVWDVGTLTTPALYHSIHALGAYGGLMVTASHNPARYNGIKLMLGEMPIQPSDVEEIRKCVENRAFVPGEGKYICKEILPAYMDGLVSAFPKGSLKVVLDCCDGASSLTAPQVFQRLGYEVVPLFCGVDGTFPNRDPNPAVHSHLTALQEAVRKNRADLGIAFDGDGDRVVFVDETGKAVTSENAFVILLRHAVKPGDTVVYDLKSSSIVAEQTQALGGTPLMERSGHAFIKRRFLENKSILAGEISGHFFFRELGYDDGLYAALRMAQILQSAGCPFSHLTADIPKKLITPDMRIPVPYGDQPGIMEQMKELGKPYKTDFVDGIRIEREEGWLLVRKSVTEEVMTVRMEARDWAAMEALQAFLAEGIPALGQGCRPYLDTLAGK